MKKKLILLPIVMMALVACGGNTSNASTEPSTNPGPTSTEPSVTPTPTPSVENPSTTPEPAKEFGIVDTPVAGTAYKLGFKQTSENAMYYMKGSMAGYYIATAKDNATDGVDVFVEDAEGGYHMYIMEGTAKKYIEVVKSGTHLNAVFTDTASAAWTYKANWKTMIFSVEDGQVFLGTYGTFNTVGASYVSKAPTSYVSHFYAEGATGEEPEIVADKVNVTGVTADASIEVAEGATKKITASVTPADATNKGLTFTSNDVTIATVSEDGVVTGVAEGSTTITVASVEDTTKTATVNVTVKKAGGEVTVEDKTATFDFATNIANFPTKAGTEDISHTVEDITLVFQAGCNYSTQYKELYMGSQGMVSFAGSDGVTVKKVIIDMYKFDNWEMHATADCTGDVVTGTVTSGTTGSTPHVVKEYEINAATFSFKNTYSKGAAMWSITIEYTK